MSDRMKCSCAQQDALVDITDGYPRFAERFDLVATGNWVKLMRCPTCGQLWKVDEWDKYQTLYALKIAHQEFWESADATSLVKDRMVQNRGGLSDDKCMWQHCKLKAVRGSAYCVNHLYDTGARS